MYFATFICPTRKLQGRFQLHFYFPGGKPDTDSQNTNTHTHTHTDTHKERAKHNKSKEPFIKLFTLHILNQYFHLPYQISALKVHDNVMTWQCYFLRANSDPKTI
jgi:hypothetical protein